MNEITATRGTRGLRLFDLVLQVTAGVVLAMLAALPIFVWRANGSVPVRFNAPYAVCWGSGLGHVPHDGAPSTGGPCPAVPGSARAVTVESDTSTANVGEPLDVRGHTIVPRVTAHISVDKHDTDARVAFWIMAAAVLAIVASALILLHRIVRSARAGDPFLRTNVRRLRLVAGSVVLLAVVFRVGALVLDHTLDRVPVLDPPLHVASFGLGLIPAVVIGLGLLALAEVFRAGCALREFEQATV